ncbi:unnamed protein product [Mytilus edulis]|uniref:Uncharacterized protein n=1 Tax=Mytilus edulis TaxID=6550 RepID=A0A8S3UYW6_MYTED|nr:unnamed protein product [Mytilus edulis]
MKSFRIESKTFLQVDEVRKVFLIESDVVVCTPFKIQRYNSTHKLEKEILFPSTDSAYIPKLDLLAILSEEHDYFQINFMNVVTFDLSKHPLRLPKPPYPQPINAIAASSDYIYYAGQYCSGRIALNGAHLPFSFNGNVGNEMIINNNEIFIPFGQYIRIYSLSFQSLRFLSGETLEQGNKLDAQQPFPNAVVYDMDHPVPHQQNLQWNYQQSFNHNDSMMPSLRQSNQATNFISMTTDQDNNVYAVNTNSQDIARWNHLNNKWDPIITSCHGLRCPSSLTFGEEFSYAYVCVEDFNSTRNPY